MNPRKFAMYGGLLMLLMGALSLIPTLVGPVDGLPLLNLDASYGRFLNYFPMNIVNKVALIVFGIAGIWAAKLPANSLPRSILFSRVVFVVMGVAAILGAIPETNTFYGYWPLFGGEVVGHSVFALLGAFYGFALTQKADHEIKTQPNLKTTFQGNR